MPHPRRRIVTSALAGIHVACILAVALLIPSPGESELAMAVAWGAMMGQLGLCAAWTALAQRRLATRLAISLSAVAALGLALLGWIVRTEGPLLVGLAAVASLYLIWLFVQVPLWMFRRTQEWCLGWQPSGVTASIPVRFAVRDLLLWTAGIALLSALGRLLFWLDATWHSPGQTLRAGELMLVGMVAVFNALLAVPAIYAALVDGWILVRLVAGAAVAAAVTVGEIVAIRSLQSEVWLSVEMLLGVGNAVQLLVILTTLLALRAAGYGLVRHRKKLDMRLVEEV